MRAVCTFLLVFLIHGIYSQASIDECDSARFLEDITDYCSGIGQYSTADATGSVEIPPVCWPEGTETNDVWFSFIAPQQGLLIQLTGETNEQLGNLVQPSLAVYEGSCSRLELFACSSVQEGQANVIELSFSDMIVGQIYFLRIDGRNGNTGTFQLCVRSFVPVPSPESDCIRSVVLCDKSSFFIDNLGGTGNDNQEIVNTCITEEFASVWYTWTAATDGSLTFTLTPNNAQDDLDFVLFHLPDGVRNCENRLVLRCMASGENIGAPPDVNVPCMGPTGLRESSGDTQETLGCQPGDDNFLAPLMMTAGETYALIVNNYSQSGFGFRADFGGTGTFLGPQPEFSIDASEGIECDKTIIFNNESTSNTDSIVGWFWNFGEGASPSLVSGEGPHQVSYNTFGEKVTALTIESSKGCRVTKIVDLEVDACCSDTSTLDIEAMSIDLSCYRSEDGRIEALVTGGRQRYLFGLDGGRFQPGSIFTGLSSGFYELSVQDSKGCEASVDAVLEEPEEIEIFLSSAADTVILGFGTMFSSEVLPLDRIPTYSWSPPDGLSCVDCPNPSVIPPGETTYTLTVEDQDGCISSQEITIYSLLTRPLYAPTAIMPRSAFGNNRFKIVTNLAAQIIEEFSIYDRWGNQLYHIANLPPDDPGFIGWDGRFNNKMVRPGVFVWLARIRFIDGEVLTFTGDFTLFE